MQRQWGETTKGSITEEFFPKRGKQIGSEFKSTNVTKIMTGHGNIRSYLHRLKMIGSPECPCNHGTQTLDHLTFQCKMLKTEREVL